MGTSVFGKVSESKVKFRQASNHCKRVLEAAKLANLIRRKSPSLLKNLALWTFGEFLIVFSTKVNLLYLLYSMAWRCCLLHLIRQKFFAKNLFKNSNLDGAGISLPEAAKYFYNSQDG